jgi:hypothetical protein
MRGSSIVASSRIGAGQNVTGNIPGDGGSARLTHQAYGAARCPRSMPLPRTPALPFELNPARTDWGQPAPGGLCAFVRSW